MKTFKGTQGEWQNPTFKLNTSSEIRSENNKCIADVYGKIGDNFPSDDEAKANAKLIAAAPELLEALIEIRKWYEKNQQEYLGTYTPVCFSQGLSAINKAL